MTEVRLVESEEGGLVPEGEGWFILNAKDTNLGPSKYKEWPK